MTKALPPEISDLRAKIEQQVALEHNREVEHRHLEATAETLRKTLAEAPSRLLLAEATFRAIANERNQLIASLARKFVRTGAIDKEKMLTAFTRALTAGAILEEALGAIKAEISTVKKELSDTEKRLKQL